jgi:DNA modification methylase
MGWRKGEQPDHDGNHEFDSVWEVDWEGKARVVGNEHPMQKPTELFARPMRKHTKPGDICFEPFSGSGSQLIAAEQSGRRCRAIELEPAYVDVALRRWEKTTGKEATLDGVPFAQVAEERCA